MPGVVGVRKSWVKWPSHSGSTVHLSPKSSEKRRLERLAGALVDSFKHWMNKQPEPSREGANLFLDRVSFHPAGCEKPLLNKVNMKLEANQMGLIFGKSGSGKTTLLQVIAGLSEADGEVWITHGQLAEGATLHSFAQLDQGLGADCTLALLTGEPPPLGARERLQHVGMVFQFTERHFVGHDIQTELTFGWPPTFTAQQHMLSRVNWALSAIGLVEFDVDTPTSELSDGFKRRLALAVQLVRQPSVLLLDEPLAGLDWQARDDMVKILSKLKQDCSLLIVSHDLGELSPLVDVSWNMDDGCLQEALPPTRGS